MSFFSDGGHQRQHRWPPFYPNFFSIFKTHIQTYLLAGLDPVHPRSTISSWVMMESYETATATDCFIPAWGLNTVIKKGDQLWINKLPTSCESGYISTGFHIESLFSRKLTNNTSKIITIYNYDYDSRTEEDKGTTRVGYAGLVWNTWYLKLWFEVCSILTNWRRSYEGLVEQIVWDKSIRSGIQLGYLDNRTKRINDLRKHKKKLNEKKQGTVEQTHRKLYLSNRMRSYAKKTKQISVWTYVWYKQKQIYRKLAKDFYIKYMNSCTTIGLKTLEGKFGWSYVLFELSEVTENISIKCKVGYCFDNYNKNKKKERMETIKNGACGLWRIVRLDIMETMAIIKYNRGLTVMRKRMDDDGWIWAGDNGEKNSNNNKNNTTNVNGGYLGLQILFFDLGHLITDYLERDGLAWVNLGMVFRLLHKKEFNKWGNIWVSKRDIRTVPKTSEDIK